MTTLKTAVKLICIVWKDGDAYVSYCPALDVYSQGDTEEEAAEAIKSAVKLYSEAAYTLYLNSLERKKGDGASTNND